MYVKVSASSIYLQTNAFEIRKLKESDYLTFLQYIGSEGDEKGYKAFRDTIDYDDMLGLFIDEQLNALFLMYDEPNEQLQALEDEGLTIGFNATEKCFNEGFLSVGYKMLVEHLLEVDVDYIAGKCAKNNGNIFKIMAQSGLTIFDEDNKNYYLIKMY